MPNNKTQTQTQTKTQTQTQTQTQTHFCHRFNQAGTEYTQAGKRTKEARTDSAPQPQLQPQPLPVNHQRSGGKGRAETGETAQSWA